jgi:hypothetical protein
MYTYMYIYVYIAYICTYYRFYQVIEVFVQIWQLFQQQWLHLHNNCVDMNVCMYLHDNYVDTSVCMYLHTGLSLIIYTYIYIYIYIYLHRGLSPLFPLWSRRQHIQSYAHLIYIYTYIYIHIYKEIAYPVLREDKESEWVSSPFQSSMPLKPSASFETSILLSCPVTSQEPSNLSIFTDSGRIIFLGG